MLRMEHPLKRSPDAAGLSGPTPTKRLPLDQAQTDETHSDIDIEMLDVATAICSSEPDTVCYGAVSSTLDILI